MDTMREKRDGWAGVVAALEELRRDIETAMLHKTEPIRWAKMRQELRRNDGRRQDGRR